MTLDEFAPQDAAALEATQAQDAVAAATAEPVVPAAQDAATQPEPTGSTGSTEAAAPAPNLGPSIADGELLALAEGRHGTPHGVLGQHPLETGETVVRARRPLAETVTAILADGTRVPLTHVAHGIWFGVHPHGLQPYQLEAVYPGGARDTADDPYRFLPTLGETDLYLFGEGRHEELWRRFGAHELEAEGVRGVSFSVWAPHAQAVRVTGSFNDWDGARHAMRRLNDQGVWELFVPGVAAGAVYKFQLLGADGNWVDKADPLARYAEVPPHTASVVASASSHDWQDAGWLARRAETDVHNQPMSIYEVHAMSWRPGLTYRTLADELIAYLDETGFTHVEFMPLAEHPFGGSWGYQVTGYFAPTSRLGTPDDLRYLIDRLHQAGYGVLMDWVPGHFPRDEFALARFDGQPLYEHPDSRLGEQQDWGTLVFDYGNSQVRNFLVANALYWLEEFHIDGLRVDAVASMLYRDYSRTDWLPNADGGREYYEAIEFLKEVNATAYKRNPGIVMVAEESTSFTGVTQPTDRGGLGFGFKWNMGWMNDNLRYFEKDPIYRPWHHNELTFSFVYAFSEQFILPISHDEVVHGKGSMFQKMPGDDWQKAANLRAFYSYQWSHPGKVLLFMGQEFGQPQEWSEGRGLDWWLLENPTFAGVQRYVAALNRLYRATPALWEQDHDPAGLHWISGEDAQHSVIAYLRRDRSGGLVACIHNFSNQALEGYRIGLPEAVWREVLNSDDLAFGGGGVVNTQVSLEPTPWQGFSHSAALRIPPLGALFLMPAPDADARGL